MLATLAIAGSVFWTAAKSVMAVYLAYGLAWGLALAFQRGAR